MIFKLPTTTKKLIPETIIKCYFTDLMTSAIANDYFQESILYLVITGYSFQIRLTPHTAHWYFLWKIEKYVKQVMGMGRW